MDENKVKQIVSELEHSYLDRVEGNIEKRNSMLPLTDERDIKSLIWNLHHSPKDYLSQISGKEYNEILQIFFYRLSKDVPTI